MARDPNAEELHPLGSVTLWMELLKAGDRPAAHCLWERFSRRMCQLARGHTRPAITHGTYDEEDVALSAFADFCHAVDEGRFPELKDRDELWRLLATITRRKAGQLAQKQNAQKRGGALQRQRPAAPDDDTDLNLLPTFAPSPDLVTEMAEEFENLLDTLGCDELRSVALWKLEGFTNEEIAGFLSYTRRTVQRMLDLIRRKWQARLPT